jgi:hypothetical protein
MSFLTANVQEVLRQYLDDTYAYTLIQSRPFFDRLTKKGNMGGTSAKVPLNLGFGGGQGGDFETALANAQASGARRDSFVVEPAKEYGVTYLENDEVPYTQTPESAVDILTDATKGAMENAAQNFEAMLFGDGYGTLATISTNSNPSGTIYRLVPTDANKFNLGNVLVSKATPSSASLDTGTATVIGLNPIGGAIEVDAGSSGWTPTNAHVLGIQGQMLASTSPSTFPGFLGWIPPITARTNGVVGDTFLTVVRTAQSPVVAVSGWAYDGRGKSLFQSVNNLAGQMASLKNSKPETLIVNPVTLSRLAQENNIQIRYDMPSGDANVYYEGFDIMTPAGKISCLAEAACPANQMLMAQAKTWVFGYPDKPFAPTSLTGNIAVESYDHNRTRFAISCSGFLYCTNPAANGVITIS